MYQIKSTKDAIGLGIIIAVLSFFIYLNNQDRKHNEPQIKNYLISQGYTDIKFLKEKPEIHSFSFECIPKTGDKYISSALALAVKAGTLRYLTVCFSQTNIIFYDAKELPELPLWVTKSSAKEAYTESDNQAALKIISDL